jgi:hypothetical protein
MKASRPCPICRLALPGQRCGWCGGSGVVEIEFASTWDGIKWHLCRRVPLLKLVLGPVRMMPNDAPATSPEGT